MAASACAQKLVLRIDDILALDWKDYEKDCHGKPTFRIVTKKTGAVSHHPVSAEAMGACTILSGKMTYLPLTSAVRLMGIKATFLG